MERLLKTPTLAPGEKIRIPVGVEQEQRETFFVTVRPFSPSSPFDDPPR